MRHFLTAILLLLTSSVSAQVIKSHGYAQFGTLKYPESFTHFDWVNPDAPKGGTLRIMSSGTFDTLNPYTLKGTSPTASGNFLQYGVTALNEPLMAGTGIYDPSGDEPASSYGLIAETLEYSEDRSWVVFNLRSEARFHDGEPVTAADVLFSYQTLLKHGHPMLRTQLQEIKRVDILGPKRIRFVLSRAGNPVLILRLGELPVLPKHYWEGRDFSQTTFEPPLTSGPYRITEVQPGRRLVYERVQNWWGEQLPVNRGKYNFDRVEVEFYRDNTVAFEAFKAGQFDIYQENQAKNWANGYRFPAVQRGDIIKAEIDHSIPNQTQALFMNTRRSVFASRQLREALGLMFDFEWSNRALFNGAYRRTDSYFPNSEFSAKGLPQGAEWLLLSPHRDKLPSSLLRKPFALPQTQGQGIPREHLRRAIDLLAEAGWRPANDGLMRNAQGQALRFEIMLVSPSLERIFLPYVENLARIGIQASLRTVDRAQYKQRLDRFDYDMVLMSLPQSLSPGMEQWQYYHSSQAQVNGSRNYAGIRHPVVDAMLEKLVSATSREQQIAAAKALDRVLLWQHYSIPNWYISQHRLAYRNRFDYVTTPPYTLGLRSWWLKPTENTP